MPTYKATALVLKKTKLGETDLICTLLDTEGIQRRVVAKGARKPGSFLASRLELYTVAELVCTTGRSLDIVTDARVCATHAGCRASLEQSAAAACLMELVEKATAEGSAEPLLYAMCNAALEVLDNAEGLLVPLVSLTGLLKLCAALGVRPAPAELMPTHTSAALAPWIERLLALRFAQLPALLSGEPEARVTPPLLDALGEFTQNWLSTHLELRLKSLEFLRGLLRSQ